VLLEIRGLVSGRKLHGIDLQVRRGEIVGLAGLMGSGRSELARAIFGIDPIDAGEILVRGRKLSIHGPSDAIDAGIALIPEDRRAQGLVLDHSVRENLLLPLVGRLSRGGFVEDRRGDRLVRSFVERLTIRLRSVDQPVQLLSGGNQQKVVIAKWLGTEPQILIMDEPTAGVDVGTKAEIVGMMRAFAEGGNAVLIISSELPEMLAVSDRVVILRDGAVDRVLDRRAIRAEEDLHRAVQGVS
jgi:ribose transport system ATP-binding protein